MGNSCTCIKDNNEGEVETLQFKDNKLNKVIKLQSAFRAFLARKKLNDLKIEKGKLLASLQQ